MVLVPGRLLALIAGLLLGLTFPVAVPPVPAVPVEHMQQWAGEQQQKREIRDHVSAMLRNEKIACDEHKADEYKFPYRFRRRVVLSVVMIHVDAPS